jgi:methionyl-tRNA formyltransferase
VVRVDKKGIAIGTAEGLLVIEQLQPPGKKAMAVVDFLNGRADWFEPNQQLQANSDLPQ